VQNFVLKLTPVTRSLGCRLKVENVRVRLSFGSKRRYYYPDVTVLCGPRGEDKRIIENSCFVVEVLSKSTEQVDRIEKLETYQCIASLQQYVLVDQSKRKIEIYSRDEKGWRYELLEEGSFNVSCLNTVMTLEDVYAGLSI
jgi:Uma2 family endonuclease